MRLFICRLKLFSAAGGKAARQMIYTYIKEKKHKGAENEKKRPGSNGTGGDFTNC